MTIQTSSGEEANIIGERCIAELKHLLVFSCCSVPSGLSVPPWRVRLQEKLTRSLAEGLDLVLDGLSHHGVQVGVQVHRGLVGEIIENIRGSDSLGSSLLVAEYQVYPLV